MGMGLGVGCYFGTHVWFVETGLGILELICELFCVCGDCAGDSVIYFGTHVSFFGIGLGIIELICELCCVCKNCAGDAKCMLKFMLCMCVLGKRLDIYVGNCFRMMGVGWGLDTHLGN